jgi:hypothetical protein
MVRFTWCSNCTRPIATGPGFQNMSCTCLIKPLRLSLGCSLTSATPIMFVWSLCRKDCGAPLSARMPTMVRRCGCDAATLSVIDSFSFFQTIPRHLFASDCSLDFLLEDDHPSSSAACSPPFDGPADPLAPSDHTPSLSSCWPPLDGYVDPLRRSGLSSHSWINPRRVRHAYPAYRRGYQKN